MRDFVLEEEQVLHLQRLAAVGQLSAAYAHEMNNLLTGVLGYASLVRRMVDDRPALARDVDRIQSQARRVADLALHLLDLSRSDLGCMDVVDLKSLVDRVLALREYQFKRRNITIVRSYSEDLPRVELMPELIEQVLLNLVNNSVQAVSESGTLEIRLALDGEADQVRLSVMDSGHGIPAEAMPRVFEPFFTTKARGQGTGLGLYVSRHIVERHGGTITARSEVGIGTTVSFTLPVIQCQSQDGEEVVPDPLSEAMADGPVSLT